MSRRLGAAAAALLVLLPGCAAPRSAPVPARIGIAAEEPAALAAGTPERPVPAAVVPSAGFQQAVAEGTRTATGAPGPRYWSQWADYRLTVSLDTGRKRLSGTARITYRNRSPDTLAVVYLHLYHNYNAPGAVRNDEAEDPVGGVTLARFAAQGQTLREADGGYAVNGTTMMVRLPRPLAPGDTLPMEAEWSFPIAQNFAERAGWNEDNLFYLAYFYPQVAVYDDVAGWHTDQHLGLAEFYAGFASYDVTIDAPEGWVVSATGELRNEAEVLPAPVIERLRRARGSDSVVHVLTAADFGPGRATRDVPGNRLRWRFQADSVRDFAFGATRESMWDAVRAPAGDRDGDGRVDYTLASALYRAPATRWVNAARCGREGVEFGARFTGYPYPWPHMTAIESDGIIGGGMEYPMMTILGALDGTTDENLFGVTVHEVLHMWVPMIASTDETRYGWMDEGMTNFSEVNLTTGRFPRTNPPMVTDQNVYFATARSGTEGEIMRWSDFHYNAGSFSTASYMKPSSVLFALRGLLGEEVFSRGYQAFIRGWAYRHPTPWDFFNAMETAAGRDLDWFWTSWYHTTWTLDQSVAGVTQEGAETVVEIRDLGTVPMPARVRVTRDSGETVEREVPVETWLRGARTATVRIPAGSPVVRVEIDPSGTFPDINRRNNVWTR
ncbi:MAG TPA: M1 family metallopeptidase [Longimicrobiaceae bacterium]|nr:M1 family metallopeptidase [Longimicrobiaceae bacterium]